MDVEIRTIGPDEIDAYIVAFGLAFSDPTTEELLRRERPVVEADRSHAAFEDGEIVGGAQAASFRMTMPGGASVPVAGVVAVGVRPTHRRRGINTALMRAQLDDVHDRGEALAALYASEAGIYGRFGYGLASFMGELNLEVERSAFGPAYRPSGRVRLLDRDVALPLMREVHDEAAADRPGMLMLDDRWWDREYFPWESEQKDEPVYYAVHDADGRVDGFATYVVKHEWPNGIPRLELSVRRMVATTPRGWADVWRYLFDVDLVHTVKAWNRPVDEPLLDLMQEPRRLRFTVQDAMFLRLVDVEAALAARVYAAPGRVVVEVADPFCPWNQGRYLVEAGPDGAAAERTDDEPEISCTVTDLGATYLGGTSWRRLRRSGRVTELREGALARADAMFAWDPAPWCSVHF
jgi:predicted acetyltransferase